MTTPDDTVTLIVAGQSFTGWESIRITRSCEKTPGSFDIIATERDPATGSAGLLPPGASCKIMIGDTLVVTGYVDKYLPTISPTAHQVQIQGRGRCEDLVDCHVTPDILQGMEVITSSLLDLATKICAPYHITVSSLTGDNVPVSTTNNAPVQFNANLQQTPYEILEEVARYAGVLIYEGPDGNLILANVGAATMASGLSQGVNVQVASAAFTMDERFQQYLPTLMSTNFFGPNGTGGGTFPVVKDPGVPRFRQRIVVSEQQQAGASFAEKRALWECARRGGRSSIVKITCDSWRDSAGALWAPNAFAPINIPVLGLGSLKEPWVIVTVDFLRDEKGTRAELELMPKEGLQPEPFILMPGLPVDTPAPAGGGADPTPPTPGGGDGPIPGGAPGGSSGATPAASATPITPTPAPAGGGGAAAPGTGTPSGGLISPAAPGAF